VRRQTRRAGGATRAGGTGMHYERRGAAALRHRCARAVGDGGPGPAVPQAAPRRTPRALPALGVEERTLCRGEPARAGGAPSHAGERSQEWQNLLAWGGASAGLPPAPLAPNARFQAREIAEARDERRLFPVACKPLFGAGGHVREHGPRPRPLALEPEQTHAHSR